MGLEFFHGFDNVNAAADLPRHGWAQAINGSQTTGRFGAPTRAWVLPSVFAGNDDEATGRRAFLNLSAPRQRIIMGVTTRIAQAGSPAQTDLRNLPDVMNRVWKFMDGLNGDVTANVQMGIGPGPWGTLRVWRGTTLVFESARDVFRLNTWHRLEADLTISDTAGALAITVDGAPLPGIDLTDTQTTANATAQTFRINMPGQGTTGLTITVDHDDLILMNDIDDGTGLHMMKGDLRCDLSLPSADFQQQFSRSTGAANWSLIDEAVLATADWVEGVAGLEDIYDLTDIGSLSLIHAIKVNMQAWRTGTTFFNATPKLYTNAANAALAPAVLAGTTGQFSRTQVLNPITGLAWTPAEINALRLGVAVT